MVKICRELAIVLNALQVLRCIILKTIFAIKIEKLRPREVDSASFMSELYQKSKENSSQSFSGSSKSQESTSWFILWRQYYPDTKVRQKRKHKKNAQLQAIISFEFKWESAQQNPSKLSLATCENSVLHMTKWDFSGMQGWFNIKSFILTD